VNVKRQSIHSLRERFRRAESSGEMLAWGIILLAFVMRTYHLDLQSLWRDEIDSIRFSQRTLVEIIETFARKGENGPLYFLLLHYWVKLAGWSEFSLRFFSVIFGLLAVALSCPLGRGLLSRRMGLLAALLMALSPYLIWYSQEGKMYALFAFSTMLSFYLYLLALRRNRPHLWAAYVFATSLSFYTHIFAVLAWGLQVVLFLLFWPGCRAAVKGWLASMAFLTLPYLPLAIWEVPVLRAPPPTMYSYYPLRDILNVLVWRFSSGITSTAPIPLAASFLFLLLAGLLLPVEEEEAGHLVPETWPRLPMRPIQVLLLSCVSVPVLLFLIISFRLPLFMDRYLIFVAPGYYLALATGLLAVRKRAPLLFLALLLLVGPVQADAVLRQRPIKSDLRGAAQYYREHHREGDVVVFVAPFVRGYFSHYYPEQMTSYVLPSPDRGASEKEITDRVLGLRPKYKRLWLILSEERDYWDKKGLIESSIEARLQQLGAIDLPQVRLRLYSLEE